MTDDYGHRRIGRPPLFDKETAKRRRHEQLRRRNKAQHDAQWELAKAHPLEYVALKQARLAEINEQCGPLPGDPE